MNAVASHPTSPFHIASGGMDGTVKIWDLRSTKNAVESFLSVGSSRDGVDNAEAPSSVLSLDWSDGLLGCGGELGIDIFKVSIGS